MDEQVNIAFEMGEGGEVGGGRDRLRKMEKEI